MAVAHVEGAGKASQAPLSPIIRTEETMNFPSREEWMPRARGEDAWAPGLGPMGWEFSMGSGQRCGRERGGEEAAIRVGRLTCNCRGGAVSGDDRVQGVALVVGGGWWTLGSRCPIPY